MTQTISSECGTWELDDTCCDDWIDYTPAVTGRAATLAVNHLFRATGRRFGTCDLTIRPCATSCFSGTWSTYTGGPARPPGLISSHSLTPTLIDGKWHNFNGGVFACSTCFCDTPDILNLPTSPVISITDITVDGTSIPLAGFQIVGPNQLVAPTGFNFPTCQNLGIVAGEEGTWSVTYTHGRPPPPDAPYALGLLACEYAKACVGEKCRLPGNLERLTRQGVTQSFDPNQIPFTGIHEVDAFIKSVNPSLLPQRSTVTTPETLSNSPAVVRWVGV